MLHGVVTDKTGRGIFTSVQSLGPKTPVTNSMFKVRFGVLSFNLDFSVKHWPCT